MIRSLYLKTEKLTRISEYLFLIFALFTSTFFIYRDFSVRMIYGYGLLGAVLALHIFRRIGKREVITLSPIKAAFLFLAVTILLCYFHPGARHDEDTLSYIIAMLVCLLYLIFTRQDVKETRMVLNFLSVSALVFCAYVLFFVVFEDYFWVSVYPYLSATAQRYLERYVNRGYAVTLGGAAYTDYIVFFLLANGIGFVFAERKLNIRCLFCLIGCAVSLFVILIVGRRGELLAAVATCVVLYIASAKGKARWKRVGFLAALMTGIVLLFLIFLPYLRNVDVLSRYVYTIEGLFTGKDVTSGRTELYQWAFNAFLDKPVFGIGWGGFSDLITPEFKALHGSSVQDVHNVYLQFLCETGIVGTLFIMAPLAYIYIKTFRQTARLRKRVGESDEIDLAIRANVVSLSVQTFFIFLGILDPCFTKYIFWCIYSIAVLLCAVALKIEGHEQFLLFRGRLSRKLKTNSKGESDNEGTA